jgi:hypothetical protein
MDKEKLFNEFLEEYLKNVQELLPISYRAQQIKAGGVEKKLVYEFETRFLKKPFENAMKKAFREAYK